MRIKKLILVLFIFCLKSSLFCQRVISKDSLSGFYEREGVIFDSSSTIYFYLPSNTNHRFTPTFGDIKDAENLFFNKFDSLRNIGNVKKYYRNYGRQYLGFITVTGNKCVLIQLLNFDIPQKQIDAIYKNFKTRFIIGAGDYFEQNCLIVIVDLTNRRISLF